MARNRNEPDTGRCAYLSLLSIGVLSCSLVYLAVSFSFRPVSLPSSLSTTLSSRSLGEEKGIRTQDRELECCNGRENLELWGAAVKWGTDFKFNSSSECCRACKTMCGGGDGPCLCDSWVFCGDKEKCGPKFGECWLKKQKDPLNPEMQDSGEKVIWTSGLIFGKGEGIIALETKYGNLHVKLFPDCAPHSVAYIFELLDSRHCAGCQFYRAEGRGSSWDSEGNHIADAPFGPPFALIQGTLETQGTPFKEIPKEACPSVGGGSVAWIGSGPEFFISLANHDEWKKAYTVFGSVLPEDMEIAENISQLPTTADTWSNIQVAILEKPVSLLLRRITKVKDLK
ncbi:uncharacterized protein [Aristolochia californica]|uniref:uncharacterized protein isoform X2 n=1 Tax=Aristolochia californica TaxID=171875 RepID=UPI0035E01570